MKLNVILTHRCNLRCNHCYMIDQLDNNNDEILCLNRWIELVNKFKELHVDSVNFTGGEVTLSENLMDAINLCNNKNIPFSIFTNGQKVSEHVMRNCDEFYVSVDGTKDVHDVIRNKCGAFDSLEKTLLEMTRLGKKIHIQTTVNKMNIDHLDELLFLFDTVYPSLCGLNIVSVTNEGNAFRNNITINPTDYNKIFDFKKKLLEHFDYRLSVKTNLFSLDELYKFVLIKKAHFPVWVDLCDNTSYVFSKENSIDINEANYDWIISTENVIKDKIRMIVSSEHALFFNLENVLKY